MKELVPIVCKCVIAKQHHHLYYMSSSQNSKYMLIQGRHKKEQKHLQLSYSRFRYPTNDDNGPITLVSGDIC